MLPEERACFIDLLIYQHQNGDFVIDDSKRLVMFCAGCSEETIKNVLQAKFKLSLNGWQNTKLFNICQERKEYKDSQSIKGKIGQFFKKAKQLISEKEYNLLKQSFENQTFEEIFEEIKNIELNKKSVLAMLKAKLKHLENEDENENINGIIIKKESEKISKKDGLLIFDQFRKKYPGVKHGNQSEFENFTKKYPDWHELINLLDNGLSREIEYRERMKQAGKFVPEWQHLKTWINQKGWTKEFPEIETINSEDYKKRVNSGAADLAQRKNDEYLAAMKHNQNL